MLVQKLGLLKPDSSTALELDVGVLCVVWKPGVGSARDAAGAVSVPEPRAHFGSSLLVLQHDFGGLMWNLPICRGILNCLLPRKPHRPALENLWWHKHCLEFSPCIFSMKKNSREKEKLLVAADLQDMLAKVYGFSILSLGLCESLLGLCG